MSWQLATFIYLLATTAFSLVYRKFTSRNKDHALLYTAMMYIMVLLPAGIFAGLLLGDLNFDFSFTTWLFLIGGGAIFAIANILAYIANSQIDAAQFNIVGNLRNTTTIFIGLLLLNESLTRTESFGVLMVISAAIWIAALNVNRATYRLDRFTFLSILSAILMGAAIANEKWLLGSINIASYFIAGWGLQTLFMTIFAGKQMRQFKSHLNSKELPMLLVLGVLRSIAGFSLVYALAESQNASLIASITSYKTALVLVGSYFLLREKGHVRTKIAATTLATVGLLLIV